MATKKQPTPEAPGAAMTDALRDALADKLDEISEKLGRPARLDELVRDSGATTYEVTAAIEFMRQRGEDTSLIIVDDEFDDDDASPLAKSLAEASGPIRVQSGDSNASEGNAEPRAQALPGMPESVAWGTYNGFRVTHGEGKAKGSFRLSDRLAGMVNGEEFVGTVRLRYDVDTNRRNAKQEGHSATWHRVVTFEIVALDLISGPLPPTNS